MGNSCCREKRDVALEREQRSAPIEEKTPNPLESSSALNVSAVLSPNNRFSLLDEIVDTTDEEEDHVSPASKVEIEPNQEQARRDLDVDSGLISIASETGSESWDEQEEDTETKSNKPNSLVLKKKSRKQKRTPEEILSIVELCFDEFSRKAPTRSPVLEHAKQVTATMIISRGILLNGSQNDTPFYDWEIVLENFSKNRSWLVGSKGVSCFRVRIEELLAPNMRERHALWVNTILNSQKNIRSNWENLFYMLSRPLRIVHPLTQERLLVDLDMRYDKERTDAPDNIDRIIYLSATFTQLDMRAPQQLSRPNFWARQPLADNTAAKKSQVTFGSLVSQL